MAVSFELLMLQLNAEKAVDSKKKIKNTKTKCTRTQFGAIAIASVRVCARVCVPVVDRYFILLPRLLTCFPL